MNFNLKLLLLISNLTIYMTESKFTTKNTISTSDYKYYEDEHHKIILEKILPTFKENVKDIKEVVFDKNLTMKEKIKKILEIRYKMRNQNGTSMNSKNIIYDHIKGIVETRKKILNKILTKKKPSINFSSFEQT
jgi:hypothetical protein